MPTRRSRALPSRRRRGRQNWTPRPQPPCSPDPSPTVQTELLSPGAEVEVRLDGEGYYGMWFEATVVGFAAARGRHIPARYSVTFDGEGDIRRFAPTHVRPRPPASMESSPRFHPHDFVEVFHERGWWSGLVLSDDPRSVTVAFPITREVITYVPRLVRPRLDYVDGVWVPSRAVVAVRPKREIRRYKVGELVEVMERGMWFPAEVAKVIDEFSYIVEYSDHKGGEVRSSEYLHFQFIRPAVQHSPLEDEFHRRTKRQGNFRQALASGKRPKSHVEVPFNGDEHSHDALYSCAKRSMREPQQNLAVLAQGSENATVSKMGTPLSSLENSLTSIWPPNSGSLPYRHSTHPKIVVSDNVQNQLERKRPLLCKVYTSKKRLIKKTEGFEDTLQSPSMGQKIRVNEIDGPQREPSLVLERSESTQQQLDSTLEDTVNASEVKYELPVAVVPLSIESTSNDIDIYGNKFDEGLTAQDNRITDVLTHNTHIQAPFVKNSCLWSALEDMDVFKEFPQQPHFLPLQQQKYPHTLQGGMAFGLMVAFDLFVGSIWKSNITDNEESFDEKKRTLAALKINGFDVQCFERLLDELIKVKFEYSKHLEEKSAVQTQKQQTMNYLSENDSLLCEIDNDIAEFEKKLGLLRQEGQRIEKEREQDQEKLSRLNEVESSIEEALDEHTLQFNGILAEVKQKRLA